MMVGYYSPAFDVVTDPPLPFDHFLTPGLRSERTSVAERGAPQYAYVTESSLPAKACGGAKDWFDLQMFFDRHPSLRRDVAEAAQAARTWFQSPIEPSIQLFDDGAGSCYLRIRVTTTLQTDSLIKVLAEFDARHWMQLPAAFRSVVTLHFDDEVS